MSAEAQDLIARMLTLDPDQRITLEEAWAHPWVAGAARWQPPGVGAGRLYRALTDPTTGAVLPDEAGARGGWACAGWKNPSLCATGSALAGWPACLPAGPTHRFIRPLTLPWPLLPAPCLLPCSLLQCWPSWRRWVPTAPPSARPFAPGRATASPPATIWRWRDTRRHSALPRQLLEPQSAPRQQQQPQPGGRPRLLQRRAAHPVTGSGTLLPSVLQQLALAPQPMAAALAAWQPLRSPAARAAACAAAAPPHGPAQQRRRSPLRPAAPPGLGRRPPLLAPLGGMLAAVEASPMAGLPSLLTTTTSSMCRRRPSSNGSGRRQTAIPLSLSRPCTPAARRPPQQQLQTAAVAAALPLPAWWRR